MSISRARGELGLRPDGVRCTRSTRCSRTASRICRWRKAFCATALRAQEPLWGDQIPLAAIERYVDTIVQSGVKIAVTWKMEEAVARRDDDRLPAGTTLAQYRRGALRRQ